MARALTTDRAAVDWADVYTAGEPRPAGVLGFRGEYRGAEVAVYRDAGGSWAAEVRPRQFVDADAFGVVAVPATDEAEAKASALDEVDRFEAAQAAAEAAAS